MAAVSLASVSVGCRKPVEPVTLTFLDPQGLLDLGDRRMVSDTAIKEFTQETGIRVNHLPTPQDNRAQLQLIRDLLQRGASAPDVYGVDTIWSGALADYLVDLKPYFSSDMPPVDPEVRASYTVQGKLIAIPYHPNSSVLYYRTDLLRKYGYSLPPRTWDELETMAARIQKGERDSGKKDFWGFIWPGTVRESLSHIALEWQVSEGGGRVIEADRTITVNNPNTVRAWERGAHWVGWITHTRGNFLFRMGCEQRILDCRQRRIRAWMGRLLSTPPARRTIPARCRRNQRSGGKGCPCICLRRMGFGGFLVVRSPR